MSDLIDVGVVVAYLLLPLSIAFAVFLVSQGMIQNFNPYTRAELVEPFQVAVERRNPQGETVRDARGQPVLEVQRVEEQVVKGGLKERFAQLRKMGIRTVMITRDDPLTAAAIAAEAGVDDFLAQATPEAKLRRIRDEQAGGHLVAMTGDGTNDAPLNLMHLASPRSAVLSAVVFNALIIIALIPLALRDVAYRPIGAPAILQRTLVIYGLGGVIVPFIGIKALDLLITALCFV